MSGVDMEIGLARVPVDEDALACFGEAARDMALTGGEDYELACTGSPDALAQVSRLLVAQGERPLVRIGQVVQRAGQTAEIRLRDADGRLVAPTRGGYDHFAGGTLQS